MWYQITAAPTAPAEKQQDELGRLLTHAGRLCVAFVTVAGRYKPVRARLALIELPERVAEPGTRALAILCGQEEATRESKPVRQRPEWTETVVLLPTGPDAAALDGTFLDGWESASLCVTYTPGRAKALLRCCAEDAAHPDRLTRLAAAGWAVQRGANPLQQLAAGAGRPWAGVPSLTPVPGGAAVVRPAASVAPTEAGAPAPLGDELVAALTDDPAGLLVGVGMDGRGVRLARRAMTLAVGGDAAAQQRAVLALIRRGMAAGLGLVSMLPRTMLEREALDVWEPRMRLLDGQALPDSATLPWREIAPDLLAPAVGGPRISTLPARFASVLAGAEAEALAVPAVLGLATVPGDDLRGALRAGGMVVVPQDDDQASQLIGRLLMALLATPPALGRGLLLLTTPALVPPPALRDQAVQVVVGDRGDALLRLVPTEDGWALRGRAGQELAALLPDLLATPAEGAGELVDVIVRALDTGEQAARVEDVYEEQLPATDLLPWDLPVDDAGDLATLANDTGVPAELNWRDTPAPSASPLMGAAEPEALLEAASAAETLQLAWAAEGGAAEDDANDALAYLASGDGVASVPDWQETPAPLASPERDLIDAAAMMGVDTPLAWGEAATLPVATGEPADVATLAIGDGVDSAPAWQETPVPSASPEADEALDQTLDALYAALTAGAAGSPVEELVRSAVEQGADGVARAITAQWVADAEQEGRAWLWRAVLTSDLGEMDEWLSMAMRCELDGVLAGLVVEVQAARSPVPVALPPFDAAAAAASIAALFADEDLLADEEPPFGAEDDLLASDADLYEEDEPLAVAADLYEEDEPIAEGLFGAEDAPLYDLGMPPEEGTAVPTWLQALEPAEPAPAWLTDVLVFDDPAPLLDDLAPLVELDVAPPPMSLLDDAALAVAAAGEEEAMPMLDGAAPAVGVGVLPMPLLDDPAPAVGVALDDAAPALPTDAALLAAWRAGTTVTQLVAQLVVQGLAATEARARVRAAIASPVVVPARVMAAAPVVVAAASVHPPVTPAPLPVTIPQVAATPAPVAVAAAPLLAPAPSAAAPAPGALAVSPMLASAPPVPTAAVPALRGMPELAPQASPVVAPMPVGGQALPGSALDAEAIWAAWQEGVPTDTIIRQMCGRRQGPAADAARATLYRVLVPRVAVELSCESLVAELVRTGQPSADPAYRLLLQRLARSDRMIGGQIERQLLQRITATAEEA